MKVLGFDGWTRGAVHYQRLVSPFRTRGMDLTLIHFGSWGDEKGRPRTEVLGDLPVRDIAFYEEMSLSEILDRERPDAVIFTSLDSFATRAVNRYCRVRHVPTVHVFHGLQQVIVPDGSAPFGSKAHRRLWLLRKQIVKGLVHFWPVYIRALRATGAGTAEWRRFAEDLMIRAQGRRPRRSADDSRATKACVFIGSETKYVTEVYGYAPADVVPVGNPDLTLFGLAAEHIGLFLDGTGENARVMYIDGALVNYGWVYESPAAFVRHIVNTRDQLARMGKDLIFKPHPAHLGSQVLPNLVAAGVEICPSAEFVPALMRCCAAIVEPSSAALVPALMGLPLGLARYDALAGQVFGEVLSSYPRAVDVKDLGAFESSLSRERADFDRARARLWIDQHVGPLPADEMPDRVADVVLSAIRDRQGRHWDAPAGTRGIPG